MLKTIPSSQVRRIHCELAKRDLWHYCKVKAPDFYKDKHTYLIEICQTLQDFENDDNELLIINIGPRHGKSRTAGLFTQWLLGNNNQYKIITASYNETLSRMFSKETRDSITEIKADPNIITFSDIFPNVRMQKGSASAQLWKLEGSKTNNYLATAPSATVTGIGADFFLIDDLVKNSYEANHSGILESHFQWFRNTMFSRLQGKRKVILIMTRWSTKDLAGRLTEMYESQNRKFKVLSMKTLNDGKMLNDEVLDLVQYNLLIQTVSEEIVDANYNQNPIDKKGRLYEYFLTYLGKPEFVRILAKCDSADEGTDYLACVIYGVTRANKAYVLDIYYTQDSMNITEVEMAKRLTYYEVTLCSIESNNGGRGFSRSVQRECKVLGNRFTMFKPYTQTMNKKARILSESTSVMRDIYFPEQWDKMFPLAYKSLKDFQRDAVNEHDDIEDCLTAVVEDLNKGIRGHL